MSESLQQLLVGVIVALAALCLGRRLYHALFKSSGGGCSTGCGKCAASEPAVIGIQPLGKRKE